MIRRWALALLLLVCAAMAPLANAAFDHRHAAWNQLLAKHVVLRGAGTASDVDYADLARHRPALQAYLRSLSAVTEGEFRTWKKPDQLAFLINAYNAHMVELVLTRYPDIRSVWDFGKLFNNPFKKRFFKLFGADYSLDMIEHDTIRARGVYDDPRIHFAVNCASIGCPMLREEAYVGGRLDAQLDEQTARFLSDRDRNRYNTATRALEVSEIFKWYGEDFSAGLKGYRSLEQFFARYADKLASIPSEQRLIREQKAEIRFLDYDWSLNDAHR